MLASCGSNESTVNVNVRELSTVKIGNLEVMTEDLGRMSWDDAKKACADLGDGWRLPTKDELNVLYENKDEIGGFANNSYWSSTELGNLNAWLQIFNDGYQSSYNKNLYPYSVRSVRAASNELESITTNESESAAESEIAALNELESATEDEIAAVNESTVNVNVRELSTVKIGSLEVMTEDLGQMKWDKAIKARADLGEGWRLPTKDELNVLYENKDEIGGFANSDYWSSTESGRAIAWIQNFEFGSKRKASKYFGYHSVRAVRAF